MFYKHSKTLLLKTISLRSTLVCKELSAYLSKIYLLCIRSDAKTVLIFFLYRQSQIQPREKEYENEIFWQKRLFLKGANISAKYVVYNCYLWLRLLRWCFCGRNVWSSYYLWCSTLGRNRSTDCEYYFANFKFLFANLPKKLVFTSNQQNQNYIFPNLKNDTFTNDVFNRRSLAGWTKTEPTKMEFFNFLWLIWDH